MLHGLCPPGPGHVPEQQRLSGIPQAPPCTPATHRTDWELRSGAFLRRAAGLRVRRPVALSTAACSCSTFRSLPNPYFDRSTRSCSTAEGMLDPVHTTNTLNYIGYTLTWHDPKHKGPHQGQWGPWRPKTVQATYPSTATIIVHSQFLALYNYSTCATVHCLRYH